MNEFRNVTIHLRDPENYVFNTNMDSYDYSYMLPSSHPTLRVLGCTYAALRVSLLISGNQETMDSTIILVVLYNLHMSLLSHPIRKGGMVNLNAIGKVCENMGKNMEKHRFDTNIVVCY